MSCLCKLKLLNKALGEVLWTADSHNLFVSNFECCEFNKTRQERLFDVTTFLSVISQTFLGSSSNTLSSVSVTVLVWPMRGCFIYFSFWSNIWSGLNVYTVVEFNKEPVCQIANSPWNCVCHLYCLLAVCFCRFIPSKGNLFYEYVDDNSASIL